MMQMVQPSAVAMMSSEDHLNAVRLAVFFRRYFFCDEGQKRIRENWRIQKMIMKLRQNFVAIPAWLQVIFVAVDWFLSDEY
jgi:hypothetical protein